MYRKCFVNSQYMCTQVLRQLLVHVHWCALSLKFPVQMYWECVHSQYMCTQVLWNSQSRCTEVLCHWNCMYRCTEMLFIIMGNCSQTSVTLPTPLSLSLSLSLSVSGSLSLSLSLSLTLSLSLILFIFTFMFNVSRLKEPESLPSAVMTSSGSETLLVKRKNGGDCQ